MHKVPPMWLMEQSSRGQAVTLKMERTHKKADAGMRRGAEVCYHERKTNTEEERVKEKVYTGVQRSKAVKRM